MPADPGRTLRLAVVGRIPLVRQFLARRLVEDALAKNEQGDFGPLVAVLASASDQVACASPSSTSSAVERMRAA